MADIVEITLTLDTFECHVLHEAVRAEGYQVELVTDMGDTGAVLPAMPGRLLVHAEDVDAIRKIINESHPLAEVENL